MDFDNYYLMMSRRHLPRVDLPSELRYSMRFQCPKPRSSRQKFRPKSVKKPPLSYVYYNKDRFRGHESPRLKVESSRTIFWSLICIAVMFFQCFEMTVKYFNYEVISTTVIEFETRFLMPGASACYEVDHVRIPTMFPPDHPCHGPLRKRNYSDMKHHDPRKKMCQKILLYDHPYTEVFNNLTWNFLPKFMSYSKFMDLVHWWRENNVTDSQ